MRAGQALGLGDRAHDGRGSLPEKLEGIGEGDAGEGSGEQGQRAMGRGLPADLSPAPMCWFSPSGGVGRLAVQTSPHGADWPWAVGSLWLPGAPSVLCPGLPGRRQ